MDITSEDNYYSILDNRELLRLAQAMVHIVPHLNFIPTDNSSQFQTGYGRSYFENYLLSNFYIYLINVIVSQ